MVKKQQGRRKASQDDAKRVGRVNARFPALVLSEVAKEVGISRGYLSNVVNGQKTPSLKVALELGRVLKVGVEEIQGWKVKVKVKVKSKKKEKGKQ